MANATTYKPGDVVTRKGYIGDVTASQRNDSRQEIASIRWRHNPSVETGWFASDIRPAPLRHWQAA